MKKILSLFIACSVLASCASQEAMFQTTAPEKPTFSKQDDFFFGFGESTDYDATSICKGADHIAKVGSIQTTSDVVWSYATLAIYTPRHVEVYCNN
ncbi:Bor/Iss family lipoprotein [Francisella sp. XLW-1]|uniref:Bor/Iss family lipoprotein n=1 Tax=Francisella sp. XLW-1 TaxID=2610887 RepID=UPI00123DC260|nr:Bor protein [Francisella sp. XLW-1]